MIEALKARATEPRTGETADYFPHKRRRKIMTLISSKARAGIAALIFAAAVVPFVLAIPAKAITIAIDDGIRPDGSVHITTVDDQGNAHVSQEREGGLSFSFVGPFEGKSSTPGRGGIVFV